MMKNPLLNMRADDLKDMEWHIISGCNMSPVTVAHLCEYGFIRWDGITPRLSRKAMAHYYRLKASEYYLTRDGIIATKHQTKYMYPWW